MKSSPETNITYMPLRESAHTVPLQYRIDEAARLLSYSPATVRRLISSGKLRSVGTGRLRRVPYSALVEYQRQQEG